MRVDKKLFSGAEALVYLLEKFEVKNVFAYPGTSELTLCNEVLNSKSIKLINGRGDKEAAFMAAGASLLQPLQSIAILHGARGLTNAAGAIGDAFRNEIGTLFIVGLPTVASSKFFPPHGEQNLISAIGNFTKYSVEIDDCASTSDDFEVQKSKVFSYVTSIVRCIELSKQPPFGPVIIGIPQDVLEKKWINKNFVKKFKVSLQKEKLTKTSITKNLITKINKSKNIIIFVDDFLYKNSKAKKFLPIFAKKLNAPIFQVHYNRGPMCFESTNQESNTFFAGYYYPSDSRYKNIFQKADLIITLEDRNMYKRVVGQFPECAKIAITTNLRMTEKNEYIPKQDIVCVDDIERTLKSIYQKCKSRRSINKFTVECLNLHKYKESTKTGYTSVFDTITDEISSLFKKASYPILVDDSQMFGGVLRNYYSKYPDNLRVFGDHGGFVGGGISLASGLSTLEKDKFVVCTLGDQGFMNALQGLVACKENCKNFLMIVCNNGQSVSLTKQSLSQNSTSFYNGAHFFLANAKQDYIKIAESFGIFAKSIDLRSGLNILTKRKLKRYFDWAYKLRSKGPVLLELRVSGDWKLWGDIWSTDGNDTNRVDNL